MDIIKNEIVESVNYLTLTTHPEVVNVKFYIDKFNIITLQSEFVPDHESKIQVTVNDVNTVWTYCRFEGYNSNSKLIEVMDIIISNVYVDKTFSSREFVDPREYPTPSPNSYRSEAKINIVTPSPGEPVAEPHATQIIYEADYDRGFQDGILLGQVLK